MKRHRANRSKTVVIAVAVGICIGMSAMLALVRLLPAIATTTTSPVADSALAPLEARRNDPRLDEVSLPKATYGEVIGPDPLADLRRRQLLIPVPDVKPGQLEDTFDDSRGSDRRHEALDIIAPRHTPVVAVEDGTVAKLFESKAGGTTVYQYDPSKTYVYYYAHLEQYAHGLREGQDVSRGDVLGYVGTSGNAPPQTPHLHFAIFRMDDKKQWWVGTPIDPFNVLR